MPITTHVVSLCDALLRQQLRRAVSCGSSLLLCCRQLALKQGNMDLRVPQLLLQLLDVHRNRRPADQLLRFRSREGLETSKLTEWARGRTLLWQASLLSMRQLRLEASSQYRVFSRGHHSEACFAMQRPNGMCSIRSS